jgi:hypothetical protein
MRTIFITIITVFLFCSCSCESEQAKNTRLQKEEQARIELVEKQKEKELQAKKEAEKKAEEERVIAEQQRIAEEARLEQQRKEKAIYDKFINNKLANGATPYASLYGGNKSCSDYGCSKIKVQTPSSSDVLVTIKKNDKVVRHAFIRAGSSYTFEMPNGTYQPFFYYGKGWNPNKVMKTTPQGTLKGGFIEAEDFGKDDPQTLYNNILTYTLILQQNGNFSTRPSNANDAL